jgi:CubicO group peptidase (beta-lactamase class C family)
LSKEVSNVTLQPGNPQDVGISEQRVRRIAELAEGWVAEGVTPALVVLAARRGVIVLHEAFGRLAAEENSPPLALDAIFPLASISKPIAATAAMILVEDGLLGLNRPVSWYIPEFTGEGKDAVMVHHLLTHTAGLNNDELDAYAERRRGSTKIPPAEATQHPLVHEWLYRRYDAPLWKPPGTEWSYSVWGYELLGEIVRRVSGRSFADFVRERIFQPLGMQDSHYSVPDSAAQRVVRHKYDASNWGQHLADFEIEQTPWANWGAYSTALDMAIFGQMFLNRGRYGDARILSPASVAEMTRDQIPGISGSWEGVPFPEALWGLGWSVKGNGKWAGSLWSPRTFEHGGDGGVHLWVDPVYEIVGVYFSVASEGGISPGVHVPEGPEGLFLSWRLDLFINAVTAAVVDGG